MKCQVCGRKNRADAQYCDSCGNRIQPTAPPSGERRQLTALFCDIVDYSRLSRVLDEEDLHRVVRAYQKTVSNVIARWGGHVESYVGDGVNAYFGYPQAHEDDAERAVRAGLEILPALYSLKLEEVLDTRHTLPALAVRVGVHTGPVVVGDLGTGERGRKQALGTAMNIASRLQGIARPGTVVMSDATERLVAGMFLTEDLGAPPLKGIDEPIRICVVLESTGVRSRLDADPSYIAPLIGRERELTELRGFWQHARSSRGQVVLISGEAGIGKSRLVRRFIGQVADAGDGRSFEWRCSPFHASTPFHPIVESLEHHLGIERGAPREHIGPRIREFLFTMWMPFAEESDLVEASNLVGEMVSGGTSAAEMSHETAAVRRSRTLNLLCDLVRAQASSHPTVIVVEDVHWADPSTIELLNLLIKRCSDVSLLLLLTFRPDFTSHWADIANAHSLSLEPLTSSQCAELFDAMVGARLVPSAVRDELLSRADGVPLFVEELTRALLASTTGEIVNIPAAIPNTLQGLLVSRLDRLPAPALETIHLAAALSREFRFEVLASVSGKPEKALREDLEELVRSGLVYRGRSPASETYAFKHALVADAAYDSILRSDRRRLHGQVAHRLREAFPAIASEEPELLAHHFGEAGEPDTAIEYWRHAGDGAIARGAYQEAVRHFDRGLGLLSQIASARARLNHEIELTESKGTALFSMLGYAHPDVERIFAHASSLCERDGSPPPLRVLYGLWAVHITRSNREAIEALLPRFADLAKSGDPVALLTAHANAGVYAFFTGNFDRCLAEMTEATRWYATSEHSAFLRRHGYGGGLYPFAWRMWSLSILGRSDQATAAGEELRTFAEQADNPYGLAIAGGYLINLARDRRDLKETLDRAERQIAYAQRQILPFWEGPAHCARGWARVYLGDVADGIAEIQLGLHYLDAVGLRATYPYQLGGLAEALLVADDVEAALAAARRGLSMCETGLDRSFEAELLRLQAESQRRLGDLTSAESGFNRAIGLARRQSATLFALRAAASLARLFIEQGRGDRARQELESVLSGVSEGLDLTDVVTARELLDAIA